MQTKPNVTKKEAKRIVEFLRRFKHETDKGLVRSSLYSAQIYQVVPDRHPSNRKRAWLCWSSAIDQGIVL